jgi:hypothetical protein
VFHVHNSIGIGASPVRCGKIGAQHCRVHRPPQGAIAAPMA